MSTEATGRWLCTVDLERGGAGLQIVAEAGRPAPRLSRSGAISVLFDGNLSDRPRLGDGLEPNGDDAEAILRAYLEVGDGLLGRLSGAFALVIWDGEGGRLLSARDAVGIHPLLYVRTRTSVALSPFVEPLLAHPGTSTAIDPVRTALRILGYPPDPGETLFTAVHAVPPGHALDVSRAGVRVTRYWDPGEPGAEEGMTSHEASLRFDALLRQAAARLADRSPAAVYLSGGIDSAAVAAVTAESSRDRGLPSPLALALMVDAAELDEEANQRGIAGDLGMEILPVSIDGVVGEGGLLKATLEVSASGSAGPADIIQPIYDHLARQGLRRGHATIANGQGGDEWLLPPPVYAADRMRRLDLPALYPLWRAWYDYLPFDSHRASARLFLWTWGSRPVVRAAAERSAKSVARLRDRLARKALERIPAWVCPDPAVRREVADRLLSSGTPGVPWRELCRTWRRDLLDRPGRPGVIEEAFATHRRTGARITMPLLDADVVRFVYRLPPGLLVHGGRAKALARDVVAERLPSFGGRWPRTVSGDGYYGALIGREAPAAWRTAGGTPCLEDVGVVDGARLGQLVANGSSPHGLWSATNLDVWLRASLAAELPSTLAPVG